MVCHQGVCPCRICEVCLYSKILFFYTGDCYSNGHFQCANSDKCVQIIYKCDGNVDCPEGEDEPSNCATGRNKMNKQNIQKF